MAAILVVDDNPDSCRMLIRLASMVDGPAECVYSGEDALSYIKTQRPKLVFLDWTMPEMDGLDVLHALKKIDNSPDTTVVIYSAWSDPSMAASALAAGAQDVILKGDFEKVKKTITKYIRA